MNAACVSQPSLPEDRFATLTSDYLNEAEQASVLALALEIIRTRYRRGHLLGSPKDVGQFLVLELARYRNETFAVIFLDQRMRILRYEELFHGTLDAAAVHPRVVVQRTLEVNAGAVILAHNHPSGVAEPSLHDRALTKRLQDALALIDVRVIDHVIVGGGGWYSFAEQGLL